MASKKKTEAVSIETVEKIEAFEVYNASVVAELLNVRRKPDINSEIITMLNKDDIVSIIDHSGDWAELNKGGFVMRKYIQEV